MLHGVILLPVLPGLGQRHNEELLAQRVLHLVVVGGLVEVAGEQLGQQLLQHVGAQEQQPTEQHPAVANEPCRAQEQHTMHSISSPHKNTLYRRAEANKPCSTQKQQVADQHPIQQTYSEQAVQRTISAADMTASCTADQGQEVSLHSTLQFSRPTVDKLCGPQGLQPTEGHSTAANSTVEQV